MKLKLLALSRRYAAGLRTHLRRGSRTSLQPAVGLGRRAVQLGLETLDLARIHEASLATLELTADRAQVRRAEMFFVEANAPIVETHRAVIQSRSQLNEMTVLLKERTAELAAVNRRLKKRVIQRKNVEASLTKSGRHYAKLLKESLGLREHLRQMTRQVLAAHEEERRILSRELQDEVAQMLLAINVRLVALKQESRRNVQDLKNEISATQRLVEKSARSTRQVARKLATHET